MANEGSKQQSATGKRLSRGRRWLRRLGLGVAGLFGVLLLSAAVLVPMGWVAFGKAAEGPRRQSMETSPQWRQGKFENPLEIVNYEADMVGQMFSSSAVGAPEGPLPVVQTDPGTFDTPPRSGLRITWLGHSTTLIEIDGKRVLTDPVFGPTASPFSFLGPSRWYPPPLSLEALPHVDAVLISHDHYDHLDYPTITAMKDWQTRFIVPLGVGAHLAYWGVPDERITEVDWWASVELPGLQIVCTPARHASGRHLFDRDHTLWAGYAVLGEAHRVFFSGDTGMFPEFKDIGDRFGPFDVTMIEVGAYNRAWPDWHIGPEQAIDAHNMLRGKVFIPIHWGLFNLAMHGWTEPVERTRAAANRAAVRLLVPRPGESLEPDSAETTAWWPKVPWQTEAEHPIVSSGM